jgi:hypothetical protein
LGNCAIVAADASTLDLGMVYRCRQHNPIVNNMTGIANIGGINMYGCFTCCQHIVMATSAST